MEPLFSSLRTRLILLVAVAMLPLLALTVYTALEQRQAAATAVQETALRLARLTSTQQGQMILGTRQLLTGLTRIREVRQRDSDACNSLFADLLEAYPIYANLGAVDLSGDVYCSALPSSGAVNLTDRAYIQRAIRTSDFAVGDYQIGRITKVASLNFGYPIRDETGKAQGVVFAALSLNWLNQLMTEAQLPEGSTFSVIDRNGIILMRYPDPGKWVGTISPEAGIGTWADSFRPGVAEASDQDGIPRLIGFTPLLGRKEGGDVYVSIGIPKGVAYAEANRLFARNLILLGVIALLTFAAAWFGGDLFILRQVNGLVETAKELTKGNLSKRIGPPYRQGELGRLAKTFDEMAASLQKNAAELVYQATHDALTGLSNRNFFKAELEGSILAAQHKGQPLAVLFMDLDRFKEINDTMGHQNGDLILKDSTERLKSLVGKEGIVARLGGDEFAVLLSAKDSSAARNFAQKILNSFEEPFTLKELPVAVEVSIGIAIYPDHGDDADLLMRRAEVAMYVAKEEKNGHVLYSSEKDQYSPERLSLLAELRLAIEDNQLYLLYQPKLNLKTRRVDGAEALVRWRHPRRGTIPPDEFIGLAERTGLIRPLTLWVLNNALRQGQAWRQNRLEIPIAVNISARNLTPELPEQISQMLEGYEIPAESLEIEITEGTIMRDPAHARDILIRLSVMGIKVSIDDFGTGYSSLSYLSRLPVNAVKIDRSFVMNMIRDKNAAAIVRSTIDMGHDLGLQVIAEGVENQQILEKLAALGCDSAQGYHINRPIGADDFVVWLSDFSAAHQTARRGLNEVIA